MVSMSKSLEVSPQHLKEIGDAYYRLIGHLSRLIQGGNADPDIIDQEIEDKGNETILVETENGDAVWIGPYNEHTESQSRIHVAITFKQKIQRRKISGDEHYVITSSVVRVAYIREKRSRRNNEANRDYTVVQGLHFDFDENPDGSQSCIHPIFHVQYDPNVIERNVIEKRIGGNLQTRGISFPDYPRIPCAPFDIVSVVYMILSEHDADTLYQKGGLPENLVHENLPKFPPEAFKYAPQKQNPMISDWWYCKAEETKKGGKLATDLPVCESRII